MAPKLYPCGIPDVGEKQQDVKLQNLTEFFAN
jgi:hypothetical protein